MTRSVVLPQPITTTMVAAGTRTLIRQWMSWLVLALSLPCLVQFQDSILQSLVFFVLSSTLLVAWKLWCLRAGSCLPILPIALSLRWLVYALPILVLGRDRLPDVLLQLVSLPLLIWPLAILAGWASVPSEWFRSRPQRSLIALGASYSFLPHILIGLSFLLFSFLNSEAYWSLFGPLAPVLRNPVTTVVAFLSLPGGFIGAYRWARGSLQDAPLFWVLTVSYFFSYLLSFLLSSAKNLVFAVLVGLWVGRARQALLITIALILTLAFLHPGKFPMREKYWNTSLPKPSPPVLLFEWVNASTDHLFNPQGSTVQGLDQRISNLGMLAYVSAQLQQGTPSLDGASYALIPQVLVPRFLNSSKVRSQEGQVLLNLHFGRQATREQTEKTYIAWGFLPEAVGNFGPLLGPLIVGFLFGALIRAAELRGAAQDLLSKPGIESLILMVLITTSYEMVATTFFAAAFQVIVLIEVICRLFLSTSSTRPFSS